MLTFPPPTLVSVTLVPLNAPETGGRFRVWLLLENDNPVLLWDRKSEGFPGLKDLVSPSAPSSFVEFAHEQPPPTNRNSE